MTDSIEAVLGRVSEKGFPQIDDLFGYRYYLGLWQLDIAEEKLRIEFTDDTLRLNRQLAGIHMMKREWQKALEYFLISSYEGMDMRLVYYKLGMKDSAIAVFDRHLSHIKKMEPNLNVYAYFDLGRIYLYHGDKKMGIELIQKASAYGPKAVIHQSLIIIRE